MVSLCFISSHIISSSLALRICWFRSFNPNTILVRMDFDSNMVLCILRFRRPVNTLHIAGGLKMTITIINLRPIGWDKFKRTTKMQKEWEKEFKLQIRKLLQDVEFDGDIR